MLILWFCGDLHRNEKFPKCLYILWEIDRVGHMGIDYLHFVNEEAETQKVKYLTKVVGGRAETRMHIFCHLLSDLFMSHTVCQSIRRKRNRQYFILRLIPNKPLNLVSFIQTWIILLWITVFLLKIESIFTFQTPTFLPASSWLLIDPLTPFLPLYPTKTTLFL